ncbi:hypothetical protein SAMN05444166_1716 [Singulisphaera sp. GP187]|nr:hypothetical protein SAMN05444166_1716 [Singulisphaera sp. GP187]
MLSRFVPFDLADLTKTERNLVKQVPLGMRRSGESGDWTMGETGGGRCTKPLSC